MGEEKVIERQLTLAPVITPSRATEVVARRILNPTHYSSTNLPWSLQALPLPFSPQLRLTVYLLYLLLERLLTLVLMLFCLSMRDGKTGIFLFGWYTILCCDSYLLVYYADYTLHRHLML